MLPLEGKLVIAIEQAVAAPMATTRLAAAGARVIKVEREDGDFARGYDRAAKGESSYFLWLNQGKESVCIDFKSQKGAQLLEAMVRKADILVQNLAPGALARSGFSTDRLHEINPQLVICNISGYGVDGDVADKRAYDLLVQAESGLISVSGSPGEPGRIGVSICDIGSGITAYYGILEALMKREKTGRGEEISISLFDVAADWMAVPFIHAEYGAGAPEPSGLRHPSIAPYGAYECEDGRQILISIQNEREWKRLCKEVLQSSALFSDERFVSNNERVQNRDALEAEISAITATMTSMEFETRLTQSKIAFGAINSADDLRGHKAFRAAEYGSADGQVVTMPAPPVKWTTPHGKDGRRTPGIGEHTKAAEREFLG